MLQFCVPFLWVFENSSPETLSNTSLSPHQIGHSACSIQDFALANCDAVLGHTKPWEPNVSQQYAASLSEDPMHSLFPLPLSSSSSLPPSLCLSISLPLPPSLSLPPLLPLKLVILTYKPLFPLTLFLSPCDMVAPSSFLSSSPLTTFPTMFSLFITFSCILNHFPLSFTPPSPSSLQSLLLPLLFLP